MLATDAFRHRFGHEPDGVWAAPGRVNLIGEHTDYNDGFVLPFALPQRTSTTARRVDGHQWTVWAESQDETVTFSDDALTPGELTGWSGYVAGVVWALREAGAEVGGADLLITSDVPVGAGLSSSAALECSVLAALADLYSLDLAPMERALLAQHAENDYVGMPCGIMDQAASTMCAAGHALLLDCRSGNVEHIPIDAGNELTLMLIDPHAPHRLVDGEYAERRSGCEAAAASLGVAALRDATEDDLDRLDGVAQRLARHVITENARVLTTVERMRAGDLRSIGPLLVASHQSLRDDFKVSVPELDLAVESAVDGGALGARLTGGGFGGTVIALTPTSLIGTVESSIASAFASRGLEIPTVVRTEPSAGATRLV